MSVFDNSTETFYISDSANNAIRSMDLSGYVKYFAGSWAAGFRDGSAGFASFNFPTGLALDGKGNLYVADNRNNAIRKIDLAFGNVTTVAGNKTGQTGVYRDGYGNQSWFSGPNGLAFDQDGSLLVADSGNNRIRKISFLDA
jgi:sugar lactone lactonase YvrE